MDEGIDLCGGWIVKVVSCVVLEGAGAGGELRGNGRGLRSQTPPVVCGFVLYAGQKIAGAFAKRPPRQGVTLPGHAE